jgi:hypothetical protein
MSARAAPRLADRLTAAHRRGFHGRQSEVALFRAALAGDAAPFAVLYVHGIGGVGKSTLLSEYGGSPFRRAGPWSSSTAVSSIPLRVGSC